MEENGGENILTTDAGVAFSILYKNSEAKRYLFKKRGCIYLIDRRNESKVESIKCAPCLPWDAEE